MSQPSSSKNASARSSPQMPEQSPKQLIDRITPQSVLSPVRMVSFWVAVSIPFLYLPLVAVGIDTTFEIAAFLSLVVVNVAALRLGHSYNR